MTANIGATRSIARERHPPRTSPGAASPAGRNRADAMTEAALTLFAERNFASVTIKDIGTALGVNTALIYYYFNSKEDLFRAAIERAVKRAFVHFRELRLRHSNPADILSDWLDNHVDLHDPIQKLVKVSLDYAGLPDRAARGRALHPPVLRRGVPHPHPLHSGRHRSRHLPAGGRGGGPRSGSRPGSTG